MRLIDADALINYATERYCKDCDKRKGIKDGKYGIIYEIGEAPCGACEVDDMLYELENAPTIDIDAVIESHENIGYDMGFRDGYATAMSEVKHGQWVKMSDADGTYYVCSECGNELPRVIDSFDPQFDLFHKLKCIDKTTYCPNCGAKMDEVEEWLGE